MENKLKNSQYWATNSFYTTKNGGITTVAQGAQQQDIRRSRIEHLPSYRRFDLSGKLQFVVVFQTIQIQRLSLEIQSLRVMLKDSERQIRNYLNYQVQIKQLTQNCHHLQQQRINYQNQLEKMSLACNSLYEELSDNKKQNEYQIQELKKEFQRNMNELCKDNEQLTKTIRDLQAKLAQKNQKENQIQNNKKAISQEIVRLNQNMLDSQIQINNLKERQAKKTEELNKCMQQLKNWQNKATQQKNFRENNFKRQEAEINELNRKLVANTDDKKKLINQNQNIGHKLAKFQDEKKFLQNVIQEFKENMRIQKEQKDKIIHDLQNLKIEFQKQRRQRQNLDNSLSNTQKQFQYLTKQYKRTTDQNNDLSQRLKIIQNLIKQQKQRSTELENYINNIKSVINAKIQQISHLKNTISKIVKQSQNYKDVANKLIKKTQQFSQIFSQNDTLKKQINKLNDDLYQIDENLKSKENYIEQLIYENKSNEVSLKNYENQIKQLQIMIKQQKQNNSNIKNEFKYKFQQLGSKNNNFQKENKRLLQQIEKIKKQGLIKDQLKFEIDKVKNNCREQENNLQNFNRNLQKAINAFLQIKNKSQSWKDVQNNNKNLREQLSLSLNLNDQTIEKVGSLYQEVQYLYEQNDKLRQKIRQLKDKQDDFTTNSSNKTIGNILSNNCLSPPPSKTSQSHSDYNLKFGSYQLNDHKSLNKSKYDNTLAFSKIQRANSPTFNSGYSNIVSNMGSFTERNNSFNTEINLSRLGKHSSIYGQTNQRKRILEPSTNFVNRDGSYSGLGSFTSRESSYGLNRYQRK